MLEPPSPADRPAAARELDTLLEQLRSSITHHLATSSPRSARVAQDLLARLATLVDGGGKLAACGGGNIEHQPALAELLAQLSRQAIAPSPRDARQIARQLEALSHTADTGLGDALRSRIVKLAEEWRLKERRASDMQAGLED